MLAKSVSISPMVSYSNLADGYCEFVLAAETDVTRLLVVCKPVTAPVCPLTLVTGAV